MTKVTILRTDGTAVRLDDKFTELKFDTEGFLIGFTYDQSTYKYLQNIDFNIKDRGKSNRQGYYAEVKFQLYMASMYNAGYQSPPINFKPGFLKAFDFSEFEVKSKDEITVEITDFGAPFNYYYKEKKYTFFLENSEGANFLKKYKRAIFDENANLIGFKIDIPSNVPPQIVDQNLMNKPSGYFFEWNYGDNVDNWQISNTDKSTYKKIVTLAAHKTYFIIEDILRKIITSNSLGRIYGNSNSGTATDPDPNELDSLEILVFNLLWSWGEFYDPLADSEYIYKHGSVVSIQSASYLKPIYHEFNNYFQSLSQFYLTSFNELEVLKTLDDREKLEKLLYILPVSALKLVPYPLRILSLQTYIVNGRVSEEDEQHMVRLILSIENFRADNFLDFLLKRTNGTNINFEVIYKLLDDARIERYPVIEWFVDEQTNRKYYAYAVYKLWKVSKYNWNYFPTGTAHDAEEINDQSYFRINDQLYNENNILEFYVPKGVIQEGKFLELKDARKYFTEMQDIAIHITSRITGLKLSLNGNKLNDQNFSESNDLGYFHIYHPMTLTGYQTNFELEFPQESMVPAFLYHYAEEYDELVDFDAGIALAINVGLEIALFFATGGGSILNDLKYLKYITKLGQAIRGGILPPTELVTIWRAAEGVSQVVAVSASTISSYQGYLATKANDEATRAHHLAIQRWMIGLMFTSIGATIYARIRAVREADKILKIIENFPAGAHGVPQNIIDLLTTLRGKQVVLAANLEARLDAINANGIIDDVIAKFNQLDNNEKYLFFEDFGKLTEEGWVKLNQSANTKIDNWLLLKNNNIIEAKNLEVISSPSFVNGFLSYYGEFGTTLESINDVKRLKIIKEIAGDVNLFNKFKNNAGSFEAFIKYRIETNFIEKFQSLIKTENQTKLFDFLKRYGNTSDEGFRSIRDNPDDYIERLMKFQEATHHIDYFNVRRTEMLPPKFIDGSTGKPIRIHEVDNYIELELKVSKKLRASLEHEAGDLIDDTTDLSYDTMGVESNIEELFISGKQTYSKWLGRLGDKQNIKPKGFLGSIDAHFNKISNPKVGRPPLDYVAIDYKYFDNLSAAIGESNPNYFKDYIDNILTTHFSQYSDQIIKLNY
ncbi:hypothetical protein [Pedobacter alluvionis]|uniref:Uncharacterized protein n=1 Tax=Pedobacter alluvionis TaxID=475253 RepID=A0A497YAC6_9SPHI|nr:hypothetical protein [Pedobacter alluvionis]RLJ80513.1 hypothetical protein BCL90_1294 [Pedobacter alluvionis]TFB31784.1 hypothetical protein E3V97_14485 [Pedobacter alluvionis]